MNMNWNATKKEFEKIVLIADRAEWLNRKHGSPLLHERMEWIMDIEGCHCNGCRLDLDVLLSMDDANFAHDVFGIIHHIDRGTGALKDCFSPRSAACYHSELKHG